jgi:hypothetical protein
VRRSKLAMAALAAARRIVRPKPESTVFMLCDVQERFRDLIFKFPSVVQSASTLVSGLI